MGNVQEAPRWIERAWARERIEIAACRERADDGVATALRYAGELGQVGQRERLLYLVEGLEDVKNAFHGRDGDPPRRPDSSRGGRLDLFGILNSLF